MYQPRQSDIQWTKDLLSHIRNGGIWGAPAMGMFTVDHDNKKLIMTAKTPDCDMELLAMTKCVLEKCGYALEEKTD